ncbi:MAG: 30S ribosomal protein S9 [Solirubrobacterales bacterium]
MDDEQKTPEQDENSQDEGAETAGPVAAGDPPPPAEQEGVPPTAPPAAEAAESEPSAEGADGEPSEEAGEQEPSEEVAEEPVAEEVTAPEADQEVEEPPREKAPKAEEKKKDVIPGADLEPILVEPEGPELSAEEQARLEAEEEEKARREAELQAADEVDAAAASRAPAKMDKGARFLATGKRKSSIARVILLPGDGKIEINKRSLEEFFPRPLHQTMVKQPLLVSGYEGNVDVRVRVHGGGISGQAGAVRHGVARALTEIDSELRGDLKRRGFLTRDARVKERRKAGLKKARKRPQFSKR